MMKKIRENKGFTLAELLIVVAIIAVLVAVAIPVFTTQLENSRQATDTANVRSAYAEVIAAYLTDGAAHEMTVTAQKRNDSWNTGYGSFVGQVNGSESTINIPAGTTSGAEYTISITSAGSVTVN